MFSTWNICIMVIFLTLGIHHSEEIRPLSIDCSSLNKGKRRVTVILLKENEECPHPGKISCKVRASDELTTLYMRSSQRPYRAEDVFPVNTWKEREMEIILDNSDVTIVPNTSAYAYLLPRAFETVTGQGYVSVQCGPYIEQRMMSTAPMDTSTTAIGASTSSLSAVGIVFTTLTILVLIALIVALIIFLIRKYKFKLPWKAGRAKPTGLALNKQNSSLEQNRYGTATKDLGVAVYVDPAAPSDYDNEDEVPVEGTKRTSEEEYSVPYMDMRGAAKQKTETDKEPLASKYKINAPVNAGTHAPKEYSYPYMDMAAAAAAKKKNHDGQKAEVNNQVNKSNKDDNQVNGNTDTPTSKGCSHPYVNVAATAKNKSPDGKESGVKRQANKYNSKGKVNTDKPTSTEYSYPYMDVTQAAKKQNLGEKPDVIKRQVSEIPYEDVEGNEYSYTYSADLNKK